METSILHGLSLINGGHPAIHTCNLP